MFSRQSTKALIFGSWAVAAGMVSAAGVTARAADILKQVPTNAPAFVVMNKLAAVDHKIKVLAGKMNLPVTSDPLAMMEQSMGISQGLDEHGSAGLVMLPPLPGHPHPQVVLFPIIHLHAAFAADGISKADAQGISTITAPNGSTGYVARHGGFAVVAQHRSELKAYLASTAWGIKGLTPATANSIGTVDFACFVNMPAVRNLALAKLKQTLPGMIDQVRGQVGQTKSAALTLLALDMEIQAARQILKESNAVIVTGNMVPSGVALKVAADVVPGSSLATLLAGQPQLSSKPLVGLPGGRFLAVGAIVINGKTLVAWLDKLATKAAQDPAINDVAGIAKARRQLKKQLAAMAAAGTSATAFDLMRPSGPQGVLMHGVFVQTTSGNAAAVLAANMAGLQRVYGPTGMTLPDGSVAIKLQPNAFVLDRVNFDRMTMHVSVPANPALPQFPMVQGVMTSIYGRHGTKIDVGVVNTTHIVGGINLSQGELAKAVKAVRMQQDPLDGQPTISGQAAHVLAHPQAVAYLPVDSWLRLAMARMAAASGGAPLAPAGAAPANPITVSVATRGNQVAEQLFIPTDQLTALAGDGRAVMMMVMMSMMNGQQPPPPPPGGAGQ